MHHCEVWVCSRARRLNQPLHSMTLAKATRTVSAAGVLFASRATNTMASATTASSARQTPIQARCLSEVEAAITASAVASGPAGVRAAGALMPTPR